MDYQSSWIFCLLCSLGRVTSYRNFQDLIPNGGAVPHPCDVSKIWYGVGHQSENGGGNLNQFGRDFRIYKIWSYDLCQLDSDKDGHKNGEELGDPLCRWKPGIRPHYPAKSHPGICDQAKCGSGSIVFSCKNSQIFQNLYSNLNPFPGPSKDNNLPASDGTNSISHSLGDEPIGLPVDDDSPKKPIKHKTYLPVDNEDNSKSNKLEILPSSNQLQTKPRHRHTLKNLDGKSKDNINDKSKPQDFKDERKNVIENSDIKINVSKITSDDNSQSSPFLSLNNDSSYQDFQDSENVPPLLGVSVSRPLSRNFTSNVKQMPNGTQSPRKFSNNPVSSQQSETFNQGPNFRSKTDFGIPRPIVIKQNGFPRLSNRTFSPNFVPTPFHNGFDSRPRFRILRYIQRRQLHQHNSFPNTRATSKRFNTSSLRIYEQQALSLGSGLFVVRKRRRLVWKPFECDGINDANTNKLTVRLPRVEISRRFQSRVCMVFNLPQTGDYHLIGGTPVTDNRNSMLQMFVYGCDSDATIPTTSQPYPCSEIPRSECQNMIGGYAGSIPGICFPRSGGIRIGESGFRQIILQVRWLNLFGRPGLTDSPGMVLYYTDVLRTYDIGTKVLRATHFSIPAGQPSYTVTSTCPGECTIMQMQSPIYVTMAFNHMHVLASPAYGVYISQLIRYGRACSNYEDFIARGQLLTTRLQHQGYTTPRLKSTFRKFFGRQHDIVGLYEKSASGRRERVDVIRDGRVVRLVTDEIVYSYDDPKAHWHVNPIHVLPGDSLRMSCVYDSLRANDTVKWGFDESNEICQATLFYYPKESWTSSSCTSFRTIPLCRLETTGIVNNCDVHTFFETLHADFETASILAKCSRTHKCDKECFSLAKVAEGHPCLVDDTRDLLESSLDLSPDEKLETLMVSLKLCSGDDQIHFRKSVRRPRSSLLPKVRKIETMSDEQDNEISHAASKIRRRHKQTIISKERNPHVRIIQINRDGGRRNLESVQSADIKYFKTVPIRIVVLSPEGLLKIESKSLNDFPNP